MGVSLREPRGVTEREPSKAVGEAARMARAERDSEKRVKGRGREEGRIYCILECSIYQLSY